MYLSHYGFNDKPFKLVHDPAYYYGAAHQVPLNELCYSIEERQGLAIVVGEPGTGKTTLLNRLLHSFTNNLRGVFLADHSMGRQPLLPQLAEVLGAEETHTGSGLLHALWSLLHEEANSGRVVVVMIDEAQALTVQQLQEVRYLTNLEEGGQKLIELILAGQPSLEKRLAAPELAGLRQRIAVRSTVEPFDLENMAAYVEHRLRVAGAPNPNLFAPEALEAMFQWSKGVARLVNIICDRALLVGYVEDARTIDRDKVESAFADLHIEPDAEIGGSFQVEAPADNRMLMRVASRLDAIEEKLDLLLQVLARSGLARPEHAGSSRMRKWLQELQEEELPENEELESQKLKLKS